RITQYPMNSLFPTRRSSDLGTGTPPRRVGLVQEGGYARPAIIGGAGEGVEAGRVAERLGKAHAGYVGQESLGEGDGAGARPVGEDRKSTRLNSSHVKISYAV